MLLTQLAFTKMHGLGNDFMVVDLVTQCASLSPETIQRLADRHTGIGFDQLLLLEAPQTPEADFRYRIFNADAREVEQCGNGARCFARFAVARGLTQKTELILETSNGLITTRLCQNDQVEVDMGAPCSDPAQIPFDTTTAQPADTQGGFLLPLGDETITLYPISMGNPHGVIFVDNITQAPVQEVGRTLSQHRAFPEGANIGFCQIVDPGFVRLRVYERGVGETRACGTGACAAVVSGRQLGLLTESVKVSLQGGKIRIGWLGNSSSVRMTGSACFVYEGTLNL